VGWAGLRRFGCGWSAQILLSILSRGISLLFAVMLELGSILSYYAVQSRTFIKIPQSTSPGQLLGQKSRRPHVIINNYVTEKLYRASPHLNDSSDSSRLRPIPLCIRSLGLLKTLGQHHTSDGIEVEHLARGADASDAFTVAAAASIISRLDALET